MRRRDAVILLAVAGAAAPATAYAQSCETPRVADAPASAAGATTARTWPAPLDRAVDAASQGNPSAVTLAGALERLSIVSGVRFSYSPELLPVERLTCVPSGRVSLGEALRLVLAGTGVVPVVAGRDQVVLAPGRTSANVDAAPELARTVGRLERVVVTGTATGGTERASPFALNVIEGAALERAGTRTVAQLLDGAVPGLWMWTQSPTSVTARYGSVRGASSFGVTTPKVYVDGIELANPLLLSHLDASRVQRIEVIRGPQGAALYGSDAISGVINVVTRQDGPTDGARAELRASAGAATSDYASQAALTQEHALDVRVGSAARTAGIAATVTTLGAYQPGAGSRQVALSGTARHVGTRLALTGIARWQDNATDSTANPLILDSASSALVSTAQQRLQQYTLGANATWQASERWTHAFVAGVDGYRQRGVASESLPVLPIASSVLSLARMSGTRVTLRANATRRLTEDSVRSASFTLGAEQSFSHERNDLAMLLADPSGDAADGGGPPDSSRASWWSTGVLAQAQAAWRHTLYFQAGARVEHIAGVRTPTQNAVLPMIGAAWVRELGPTSLKLRGAYGEGIRPVRMGGSGGPLGLVEPEEQTGTEFGADFLWDAPAGTRVGVQATRFDQLASHLAQPVAMMGAQCAPPPPGGTDGGSGSGGWGGGPGRTRDCYGGHHGIYVEAQNVGRIRNDGWEMQASVARGALTLATSLALVDSRVDSLAPNYTGDLRRGDRMLGVPARTLGLTASWRAPRWTIATTLARANDWRNYDRAKLAAATAASDTLLTGLALRPFVRGYDGVTRLGARLDVTLWRATALTLRLDNLLDSQVGEPDNVTVLPGRTVVLGIRTGF